MAGNDSTDSTIAIDERSRKPLFESFNWHQPAIDKSQIDGENVMRFANDAKNIVAGVSTIMEILEHDKMCDGFDQRPLLTEYQRSTLRRLGIESLDALNERCDDFMKWAFEFSTPEGIAARKARHGA
jgi:hypothetical protein